MSRKQGGFLLPPSQVISYEECLVQLSQVQFLLLVNHGLGLTLCSRNMNYRESWELAIQTLPPSRCWTSLGLLDWRPSETELFISLPGSSFISHKSPPPSPYPRPTELFPLAEGPKLSHTSSSPWLSCSSHLERKPFLTLRHPADLYMNIRLQFKGTCLRGSLS